jgi:Mrp family chromosome partitioning ATPase
VLILAPPAAQYGDAALLGQETDGVILILESNQTRRETARIATQNLTAAKVQVLGAVLNNRTFPIPESIYRKL